ncbi:synaptotagmin-10-like [Anneissia japonica]|uniref:synaptotagmin-10-like n=1 Tax=Anneissia japonica TaxID=1529436 RepID=UPI0014256031|nr:synaptotagmin-10-like [Anneissia japonica]
MQDLSPAERSNHNDFSTTFSPMSSPAKVLPRQATVPILTQKQRQEAFRKQLSLQGSPSRSVEFEIKKHLKEEPKIGNLRPELYRNDFNEAESRGQLCGKMEVSLKYDQPTECLTVNIIKATGLPAKDFSGTSDPYVKIYLYPDRKKFQTKVHRKTCNPIFHETFEFNVAYADLSEKSLKFTIYDFDRFSRHDLIGEISVDDLMSKVDPTSGARHFQLDIYSTQSQERPDLGEIMFSLCFLPTAHRLSLNVLKARNLRAMDITGASETSSPISISMITSENNRSNETVGHSELIGVCEVGANSPGQGSEHWQEMLQSPRKQVANWHQLMESSPSLLTGSNLGLRGCITPQQSTDD